MAIRRQPRSDKLPRGRYATGGVSESLPTRVGWWDKKQLPTADSDVATTLEKRYHRRPDLLAYDMYGAASLMWVVLQYNNIIDVTTEFVEGTEIVLPTKARLFTQLLTNN